MSTEETATFPIGSTLPPHVERMMEETKELGERIKKLSAFLGSEVFASLSILENSQLQEQYGHMVKYYNVLCHRIATATNGDVTFFLMDVPGEADVLGSVGTDTDWQARDERRTALHHAVQANQGTNMSTAYIIKAAKDFAAYIAGDK